MLESASFQMPEKQFADAKNISDAQKTISDAQETISDAQKLLQMIAKVEVQLPTNGSPTFDAWTRKNIICDEWKNESPTSDEWNK